MSTSWYYFRQDLMGWLTGVSIVFWVMSVASLLIKLWITRKMVVGEFFLVIMMLLALWSLGYGIAARFAPDDEICKGYQTLSIQVLIAQSLLLAFYPVLRIIKLLSNGAQIILLMVFCLDIYFVLRICKEVLTVCESQFWTDSYWHVPSMVFHCTITFGVNTLCMWWLLKYIKQSSYYSINSKLQLLKKVLTTNLVAGCVLHGFGLTSCIIPPIRTSRIFLTWHIMLYFSVVTEILFSLNSERSMKKKPLSKSIYC
eukprot:NODE_385_length_9550_cov_0.159877.p2 type:complete len:256 gc:universal NODE_385_length_9550_cov_0.159877:4798-5565(+)